MGFATTVVVPGLRDDLIKREGFILIGDTVWCHEHYVIPPRAKEPVLRPELRYLEFLHPDAPDGRHVDVILDEEGLRFKPDQDV